MNQGESRAERRWRAREERKKVGKVGKVGVASGVCRFPNLFDTPGCCICGHNDASKCPCSSIDALAHLELVHLEEGSAMMRDTMGCPILDSEAVPPTQPGQLHTGMFQAPCGEGVYYEVADVQFPTMGHFRWHAIYNHLSSGNCPVPNKCGEALRTGQV